MKKRETVLMLLLISTLFVLASCAADGKSDDTSDGGLNAKNSADGDSGEDPCDLKTFEEACSIGCPYGYEDGADNCPICECATIELPNGCRSVTCPNRCPGAYLLDENSCISCECSQ